MFETVSTYALLCQSRPRPPKTIVTAYDLYSQASVRPSCENPSSYAEEPSCLSADTPVAESPVFRRTHYIADIHARHGKAGAHAVLNPCAQCAPPLPPKST